MNYTSLFNTKNVDEEIYYSQKKRRLWGQLNPTNWWIMMMAWPGPGRLYNKNSFSTCDVWRAYGVPGPGCVCLTGPRHYLEWDQSLVITLYYMTHHTAHYTPRRTKLEQKPFGGNLILLPHSASHSAFFTKPKCFTSSFENNHVFLHYEGKGRQRCQDWT